MRLLFLMLTILNIAKIENIDTKEVKIYYFSKENCHFCEQANNFFLEIENDYGKYFEVIELKIDTKENLNILTKITKTLKTEAGVPYIIIGSKYFLGYDEEYNNQILQEIKIEYEKKENDRIDIVYEILHTNNKTAIVFIISLIIPTIISVVIYYKKKRKLQIE